MAFARGLACGATTLDADLLTKPYSGACVRPSCNPSALPVLGLDLKLVAELLHSRAVDVAVRWLLHVPCLCRPVWNLNDCLRVRDVRCAQLRPLPPVSIRVLSFISSGASEPLQSSAYWRCTAHCHRLWMGVELPDCSFGRKRGRVFQYSGFMLSPSLKDLYHLVIQEMRSLAFGFGMSPAYLLRTPPLSNQW